jgi:GNAT superfamily N-acetyltransferase
MSINLHMGDYKITEVVGVKFTDEIQRFNGLFKKEFLPLKERHLNDGYWWLVHQGVQLVAFAGMVPFEPFPRIGYLKRAAVLKEHRGKGIQAALIAAREERARVSTDWTHLITETSIENPASSNSFARAGYRLVEAERPWAKETLFWRKTL